MERWNNKVAFVTGVSSGIGRAIVEKFVEEGLIVVGVARRKERLDELAKEISSKKGKFHPYQADISKEEEILKVLKWTMENVGPVSIIVNNAGLLLPAKLTESSTQQWKDVIDVNVLAVCIANREAIKQMKESKTDGQIININSVAGHKITNFPGASMYHATKHAISVLTETLRLELAAEKSKIKVTSLSPGIVRSGMNQETPEEREYINSLPFLNPSDIADAAFYVLTTPAHVQITELTIQPVLEQF